MARSRLFLVVLSGVACAALTASPARAQWINFTDQTNTRMMFNSISAADPDEKAFALGDFDKDGDLDLVDVRKAQFYVNGARSHVLFMNQSGIMVDQTANFAPGFISHPSNARLAVVADFNGDTWPDLIIGNTFFEPMHMYMNLASNAGGWIGLQFDTTGRIPTFAQGDQVCGMAAGDIDNDGDIDIYMGDYNSGNAPANPQPADRLLINDGTGYFTDQTAARIPGGTTTTFTVKVFIRDMNNDGWNDIIYSEGAGAGIQKIRINDGTGHFPTLQQVTTNATYTLAIGDLNNDGKLDLFQGRDAQDGYAINTTPTPTVGTPHPTTSFAISTLQSSSPSSPGYSPATLGFSGNPYLVDMDNDGYVDLVMADTDVDETGCGRHSVMLRNQPGASLLLYDPWNGVLQNIHTTGTFDIAVVDLNGDGFKDMIYGLCTGYKVFMQVPPPFQLALFAPLPGALQLTVTNATPNQTVYNVYTTVQLANVGTGPAFGLDASAFLNFVSTYGVEPFTAATDAAGHYSFSLPAGSLPSPLPIQARAIQAVYAGGVYVGTSESNIVTVTF